MTFLRSPNQQDLSWFVDMQAQGRLELNPEYQRKSVWTYKDKQFFLDTVFNNYPCPAVYLQKENTPTGPLYNVVDGKQRLSTVLDFYAGKIRINKEFSIVEMRGLKFKDLTEKRQSDFYNYIFMVEQIRSESSVDWGEVFQRVNKNQKKLTDQELRHARFDGWLISKAENEVVQNKDLWKTFGISSTGRAKRMKDVEFISILMLVSLEKEFVGFPQFAIDNLYAKYDFSIDELVETEADIEFSEDEDEATPRTTKEDISNFEKEFEECRGVLAKMQEHNQCISNHKRRITTDLYSLWAAISMDEKVRAITFSELAEKYDTFMTGVEEAFALTKAEEDLGHLDAEVQSYHINSTGAATEVDYRRKRHQALTAYLLK